jgi:hypothetical protein
MLIRVHSFEQRDFTSVPRLGARDQVAGIVEKRGQEVHRSFGVALVEPSKRIEAG